MDASSLFKGLRRVRLTEPVGGWHRGKAVIVPAGTEGLVAEPWPGERGFPIVIDVPPWLEDAVGGEFDGARCAELVEAQVEEIEP